MLMIGQDVAGALVVLPAEAVSQTFGALAVRGAGKSTLAAVMAEEMYANHLPFVYLDPVGTAWGLRSTLDIPIFGGKHGDLPLDEHGGDVLADAIAQQRLSCVIDLSAFESEAAKKRFLLAFARRLYQVNEHPLHLFLEEADDYIPQKPLGREEPLLLRAFENIVRRGRARGLGCTLITQRSAVVNKNVLTQVETLFVLRTTGPQDVAAVKAWMQYQGVDQAMLASLASLKNGEAYIWSPHFLHRYDRIQIRPRQSHDSGATPKSRGGSAPAPPRLRDIDLDRLESQLGAAIQHVKDDSPKHLKSVITELLAKVKELEAQPVAAPPAPTEVVPPHWWQMLSKVAQDLVETGEGLQDWLHRQAPRVPPETVPLLAKLAAPLTPRYVEAVGDLAEAVDTALGHLGDTRTGREGAAPVKPRKDPPTEGLTPYAQAVLDALRVFYDLNPALPVHKHHVAAVAGKKPKSSMYEAALAGLRAYGYMDYHAGGQLLLRPAGLTASRPQTLAGRIVDCYMAHVLNPYEASLVRALIPLRSKVVTRQALADAAQKSAASSLFEASIASLRKLGLLEYVEGGVQLKAEIMRTIS